MKKNKGKRNSKTKRQKKKKKSKQTLINRCEEDKIKGCDAVTIMAFAAKNEK